MKGQVRNPNDSYELMYEFLKMRRASTEAGQPFTSADVSGETGVKIEIACNFLRRLSEKGGPLIRTRVSSRFGRGTMYTYLFAPEIKLPKPQLSKGEVANLVWRVFKLAKKPLSKTEVARRVGCRTGRLVSRNSVSTVVYRWYGFNHLARLKRGKYQLKNRLPCRPLTLSLPTQSQI
ncbi:MAG: hypothetical protein WCT25_01285 [Candidatus Paceibacterota bacterium]